MSREYAEQRIREALKSSKGHTGKATQKIIAQAMQDQRLLLALTQGHLTGIAALWVNRVVNNMKKTPEPTPEEPEPLDMGPASFGKELLSTMQNKNTAKFGIDTGMTPATSSRKKASQNHINALRHIASKSKQGKS